MIDLLEPNDNNNGSEMNYFAHNSLAATALVLVD